MGNDVRAILASITGDDRRLLDASSLVQRNIGWGDHVVRFADHPAGPPDRPLVIFGAIPTEAEYLRAEGLDVLDIRREMSMARGYRWGRWHSSVVPDGELGSAHVVNLQPISSAEFDDAGSVMWEPSRLGPWFEECAKGLRR